jgi:hypothetical protein
MRGNDAPRFKEDPAPGTGPLGDDLCDESPTGQGREVRVYPDMSPVCQGGGVGKR